MSVWPRGLIAGQESKNFAVVIQEGLKNEKGFTGAGTVNASSHPTTFPIDLC